MRKAIAFLLTLTAACLFSAVSSAQILGGWRFGVTGAYVTSNHNLRGYGTEKVKKYNVGVTLQIPLVSGVALQPSVLYQVKGNDLSASAFDKFSDAGLGDVAGYLETNPGFIEIPVQVQWGPDLMFFRPYVFAEPFVGFRLTKDKGASKTGAAMNDTEYGLGLGAGLELGMFQFSVRYYWNMGDLYDTGNVTDDAIKHAINGGDNYKGTKISLVIFL